MVLSLGAFAADNAPEELSKMDIQTKIQLMKQFDKDGDGRLNAEERKEAMEAIKNKSADLKELREKHVEKVMKKFDKDGDGKLSFEERREMFKQAREARNALVRKYDADGDGKLSDDERDKLMQDPEVKAQFKRMFSRPMPAPRD